MFIFVNKADNVRHDFSECVFGYAALDFFIGTSGKPENIFDEYLITLPEGYEI